MKYLLILFSVFTFGQASNQMITFTAAQSLGFSLNSGQSHVTSNQCMTKSEILTKYNVSSSNMSSYTDNQLVPKGSWGIVTNSVVFSSWYLWVGGSGSTSGTVTITGNDAVFGAVVSITSYTSGSVSSSITINGITRIVSRSSSGASFSTTFLLTPGTYNYSITTTKSGDNSSAAGIDFTQ